MSLDLDRNGRSGLPWPAPAVAEPVDAPPYGTVRAVIQQVLARLDTRYAIGLPGATDIDFAPLYPVLNRLVINHGDPEVDGVDPRHVKDIERDVVSGLLRMFRGVPSTWWGYVTSGSTASNRHAIRLGLRRWPDAIVYRSAAAHTSVEKVAHEQRAPVVVVPAAADGTIRADELTGLFDPTRPALVVVTAGTTMTEGIDDLGAVRGALADAGVIRHHVHCDAALSGVPLALSADPPRAVRLDHPGGPDSLCISGQKFLGTKSPCGVMLARRADIARIRSLVPYTHDHDVTSEGCRSGHDVLRLWYVLATLGWSGLRARAQRAIALAEHTAAQLRRVGVPARRHPHAMTVTFPAPPHGLVARWGLACEDGTAHLITMPGVAPDALDQFVAEMAALAAHPPSAG